MVIPFILLLIGAYLVGSVPAAQVMAKLLKGIDLKQFGSGNVGASNLIKATSKWAAIPVILFDFAKGLVFVLLARWLGLNVYAQAAVGLTAIAGHSWPVFLNFSGGRGILTSLGVSFALMPWLTAIALSIAGISALFRQMALGVLAATVFLPLAAWLIGPPLGVTDHLPYAMFCLAMFIVLAFRRLTAQTPAMAAPVPRGERFINRLLFDRDIRDREAWLNRLSGKAPVSSGPNAKNRNKPQ